MNILDKKTSVVYSKEEYLEKIFEESKKIKDLINQIIDDKLERDREPIYEKVSVYNEKKLQHPKTIKFHDVSEVMKVIDSAKHNTCFKWNYYYEPQFEYPNLFYNEEIKFSKDYTIEEVEIDYDHWVPIEERYISYYPEKSFYVLKEQYNFIIDNQSLFVIEKEYIDIEKYVESNPEIPYIINYIEDLNYSYDKKSDIINLMLKSNFSLADFKLSLTEFIDNKIKSDLEEIKKNIDVEVIDVNLDEKLIKKFDEYATNLKRDSLDLYNYNDTYPHLVWSEFLKKERLEIIYNELGKEQIKRYDDTFKNYSKISINTAAEIIKKIESNFLFHQEDPFYNFKYEYKSYDKKPELYVLKETKDYQYQFDNQLNEEKLNDLKISQHQQYNFLIKDEQRVLSIDLIKTYPYFAERDSWISKIPNFVCESVYEKIILKRVNEDVETLKKLENQQRDLKKIIIQKASKIYIQKETENKLKEINEERNNFNKAVKQHNEKYMVKLFLKISNVFNSNDKVNNKEILPIFKEGRELIKWENDILEKEKFLINTNTAEAKQEINNIAQPLLKQNNELNNIIKQVDKTKKSRITIGKRVQDMSKKLNVAKHPEMEM